MVADQPDRDPRPGAITLDEVYIGLSGLGVLASLALQDPRLISIAYPLVILAWISKGKV